jgi:hypothetical protein
MRCYTCGNIRHMSWDCSENKSENQRSENVAEAKDETINAVEKEETPEVGDYLMLKRILVKLEKETSEPTQRKIMFTTVCKSKGSVEKLSLTVEVQIIWFP